MTARSLALMDSRSRTVTLGPAPCSGCRAPLTWDGWAWLLAGKPHECPGWRARCMSDREWELWREANADLRLGTRARRPCDDCLVSFALAMRGASACNGTPGTQSGRPVSERRRAQWRAAKRRQRAAEGAA